jgi:hypothetical protein
MCGSMTESQMIALFDEDPVQTSTRNQEAL